jgi:hypothetical protein
MFSEIWDSIVDGFDYLIHFEWAGDLWDGITDFFSNISEVSSYGIIFGIIGCAFILFTSKWMLGSFTSYMKPMSKIIVTILTYVVTFLVSYVIGKRFQDTG